MKSALALVLLAISYLTYSEVDLRTIDDFGIYSLNEHDLVVSKQGKTDKENFLAFRMERPFCLCTSLVISLKGTGEVKENDYIKGTISIDMKKPHQVNFRVLQEFESGYLLLRPYGYPSIRSSKFIKVRTEIGSYETFLMQGIDNVMEQSKSMCESEYLYEYVEPKTKEMELWELESLGMSY